MNSFFLAFLALSQVPSAAPELRVGVAASDSQQHCLALAGAAPDMGTPVALITPTERQRVYRALIVRSVSECPVMTKHATPGPYYLVQLEVPSEPPRLAVAVVGRPTVRLVAREVQLRLSDRLREARIRICSSSEGLHLTVWSGAPLKTTRLWHAYWYLGFDVEPDCRAADYREDSQQATADAVRNPCQVVAHTNRSIGRVPLGAAACAAVDGFGQLHRTSRSSG
jgi:hypothetical protein